MSIEGKWIGPDKVAHALWSPAITGWAVVFDVRHALMWWLGSMVLALFWEASNYYFVFEGKRGISVKDAVAFAVGFVASGLLLLAR